MEQLLIKTFEHSPALVSMVIIVHWFLKHLKEMSNANSATIKDVTATHSAAQKMMIESHTKRTDEFIATVKEINGEASRARDAAQIRIDQNTIANTQNTLSIARLTTEITHLANKMENR